jgi:hypothetical protein
MKNEKASSVATIRDGERSLVRVDAIRADEKTRVSVPQAALSPLLCLLAHHRVGLI